MKQHISEGHDCTCTEITYVPAQNLELCWTRNSSATWKQTLGLATARPSSLPPLHVKVVTGTGAVRLQRLAAVAPLIILTAIVAPSQFASL